MIELDISQFLAVLLIGIAVLAGLGVAWDRLHERGAAKAVRRSTVRCRICGAASRRQQSQSIQFCPECGSANRGGRDRRLG